MLKTVPDQPPIVKNATYGFAYLWYNVEYSLGRNRLQARNLGAIIIILLFTYLFQLLQRSLKGALKGFTFGKGAC